MEKSKQSLIVPEEKIIKRIVMLRDEKVILDLHLAELYGVETSALKQAVRRNMERFPEDFMFGLTA
ncbi:ORF6N domain-containing protein [Chitinophaga polysaccharea]|uniref:ORF6N domain-containing protein n=1 Tax=Chitinophaga polysaccharea TaxID=1293035 RepID=UPI001158B310|nr:ORF6N domain-containing protein [Chitinophaga polysaccharea]